MSFVNVTGSRGVVCAAAARGTATAASAAHNPTADRPRDVRVLPLIAICHSPPRR